MAEVGKVCSCSNMSEIVRITQLLVRCMINNWGTKDERYDGETFVLIF